MVRDFLDRVFFMIQHMAFMGIAFTLVYVVVRASQQGISFASLLDVCREPFTPYMLLLIPLYFVLILLHVLGGRIGILGSYTHLFTFFDCIVYELKRDLTHPIDTITDFIDSFSESNTWFRVRAVTNFVFWGIVFLVFLYAELALLGIAPKMA